MAALLPLLGLFSIPLHVASHPFELFLDFQYGLQRWLLLGYGAHALRSIETTMRRRGGGSLPDESASTDSLFGGQLALAMSVGLFQLQLSACGWAIATLAFAPSKLSSSLELSSLCSPSWYLAGAVSNTVIVFITLSLVRFFRLLTKQPPVAWAMGFGLLLAGLTQPNWSPLLAIPLPMLPWLPWLESIVPAFWRLDTWWLTHIRAIHSPSQFVLRLLSLGCGWIISIHLACWAVMQMKRS